MDESSNNQTILLPVSFLFNIGRRGEKPRPITHHDYDLHSRGPPLVIPNAGDEGLRMDDRGWLALGHIDKQVYKRGDDGDSVDQS